MCLAYLHVLLIACVELQRCCQAQVASAGKTLDSFHVLDPDPPLPSFCPKDLYLKFCSSGLISSAITATIVTALVGQHLDGHRPIPKLCPTSKLALPRRVAPNGRSIAHSRTRSLREKGQSWKRKRRKLRQREEAVPCGIRPKPGPSEHQQAQSAWSVPSPPPTLGEMEFSLTSTKLNGRAKVDMDFVSIGASLTLSRIQPCVLISYRGSRI